MRKLLLAASAAALLAGIGSAANAEVQQNYASVTANTNINNTVLVGSPLSVTTAAVGNVISADVAGNFTSFDNQETDNHLSNAISATTNVDHVTALWDTSVITSQAIGNAEQLKAGGNIALSIGGAGSPLQHTGGAPITAITNVTHDHFGAADVTAAATGNSISLASTYGTVALGDTSNQYYGLASQLNNSVETSALTIDGGFGVSDSTFDYKLDATSQSVGNAISALGSVAPKFHVLQTNAAGQTATALVANSFLNGADNSVSANAIGNIANFGTATTGGITQINLVGQNATTTLFNSKVAGGAFSAQAVGDALSFTGDSSLTDIAQISSGPGQHASVFASNSLLTASTSFSALAVSNSFDGTSTPGIDNYGVGGVFAHQKTTGDGPVSLVSLSNMQAVGTTEVNSSAVGNLATLTSPGAFIQVMNAPSLATATVTGSSIAGPLNVNTTAIGNSLTIH